MLKYLSLILCTAILQFSAEDISTTPIHWGFKKSQNHLPPSIGKNTDDMLLQYNSLYIGDTSKKNIYLTFDNGYENGHTSQILDVLKKKKVPATFFVTGHYLDSAPELVKRMEKEGHIIGNHSWSHPNFTRIGEKKLREELEKVRIKTHELTGQKKMIYLRPPQGVFNEKTLSICKELGYRNVLWSLAFVDWEVNHQKGWKYSYDNIMKQIHPGAIILLHAVSKDNAEALERVINDLQKDGYTFKSLDQVKN